MVSNREIRQFDTIKQLGDIVKRQNAKLDSLSEELENACNEVAEVKTELQTVRHKLDRQPHRYPPWACSKATKGLCKFLFQHCNNRRFLLSFDSGMGSILSLWDSIPFFSSFERSICSLLCDVNTACHMAGLNLSREE